MAISETSVRDAEALAINEINAAGGVLGKQLVPVIGDGASSNATFTEEATRLFDSEGPVLGTPVYYASPTGEIELFLNHLWARAKRELLAGKPCAVLASVGRAAGVTLPEASERTRTNFVRWRLLVRLRMGAAMRGRA